MVMVVMTVDEPAASRTSVVGEAVAAVAKHHSVVIVEDEVVEVEAEEAEAEVEDITTGLLMMLVRSPPTMQRPRTMTFPSHTKTFLRCRSNIRLLNSWSSSSLISIISTSSRCSREVAGHQDSKGQRSYPTSNVIMEGYASPVLVHNAHCILKGIRGVRRNSLLDAS